MAKNRKRTQRLTDTSAFPGFRPLHSGRGVFGDPKARIVTLPWRSKKRWAASADERTAIGTTDARGGCAICHRAIIAFIWSWRFDVSTAGDVAPCSRNGSTFSPTIRPTPSASPTTSSADAVAAPRSRNWPKAGLQAVRTMALNAVAQEDAISAAALPHTPTL